MPGVRGRPLPNSPESQVPTAHPEAELWFGAHPGDPAWLETDTGEQSLLDTVRSDPEGQLGGAVRNRFGDTLPFLMKVLAADEPLSLQAHPSAEQAAEGFAREDRLGIPVSSPIRNYRDRSHKPELLVALGTFEVLAGFRPAAKSVELLRALAVSDLDPFVNLLAGPAGRRRPARAVHHLDHRAAAGSRRAGARRDRRRHQLCPVGRERVRGGGQDGARARRALPRRRRGAGLAAAEPVDSAPRRRDLSARRQSAHVSARRRDRGNGQLRQRPSRWADPETRRRSRVAAGAGFHAGQRGGPAPEDVGGRDGNGL